MIDLESIPEGYGISRDGVIHPVSCVSVSVGLDVADAGGEIKESIERPAESLLRTAARTIMAMFAETTAHTVDRYSDGADHTITWRGAADERWGPRDTNNALMHFGTGTTAVTVRDFVLDTNVYDAIPTISVTSTSTNTTVKLTATVTATGSATITEIMQRMQYVRNSAGATLVWVVARDVFDPGLAVVNGDIITGKYIFSFDV